MSKCHIYLFGMFFRHDQTRGTSVLYKFSNLWADRSSRQVFVFSCGTHLVFTDPDIKSCPPMAKRGLDVTSFPPQQIFPVFLGMGRAFIPNKFFSCRIILETSVHEKDSQIGPTVLAVQLDKGRVLGYGNHPHGLFYLFF